MLRAFINLIFWLQSYVYRSPRPLPPLPRTIEVITKRTSEGLHSPLKRKRKRERCTFPPRSKRTRSIQRISIQPIKPVEGQQAFSSREKDVKEEEQPIEEGGGQGIKQQDDFPETVCRYYESVVSIKNIVKDQ